ncbi:hypothetical protein AB0N07_35585 [Streptomyces sp. NPDC051172]|uniref:hypothetical protein n=1 Tax=Streptomyces sp. NPDC051172 TaxID=3155796 RepID=UPI003438EDE9
MPVTTTSLAAFIGPVLLLDIGFICVVSSLTWAAVNAVPIDMTGMAGGATSLVREFGQALGPAVIGTVAMSAASSVLAGRLSGADAGMEAAAGPLTVVNAGMAGVRDLGLFSWARRSVRRWGRTGFPRAWNGPGRRRNHRP